MSNTSSKCFIIQITSLQTQIIFGRESFMIDKKIVAPLLDDLIQKASGAPDAPNNITKSQVLLLIDKTKTLDISGNDERRDLWLWTERGTIEDFGDYNEYLEYGDVESREEFQDLWRAYYPDELKWYKLTFMTYGDITYIYFGGKLVFQITVLQQHDYSVDNSELAMWLTDAVDKVVEMLRNETYNQFVADNLSFHKRLGKIKRRDYWDIFPELRQDYFNDINSEEIQEFLGYISKQPEESPATRLAQITAGFFFDCCKMGYAANNYKDSTELSAKQLYINNADGRNDGLLELEEDSVDAFADWYHNRINHGGHPWEVCRGGNSTHISLYVNHDAEGWYLSLAGSSYGRSVETIKFYLALAKQGVPIYMYDSTEIVSRLIEADYIGIVPEGVFPRYCTELFPDEKMLDFMNLPDENTDKVIAATEWYHIPQTKLLLSSPVDREISS